MLSLHHTHLYASDADRSIAFWRDHFAAVVLVDAEFAAVRDDAEREPALITFLVTASGLSLFGVGSAFWGLVAGLTALLVLERPHPPSGSTATSVSR